MTKPLSITTSIKIARSYVSLPQGRKTSWTVMSPWDWSDKDGPNTATNADSYWAALSTRQLIIAYGASVLIGLDGDNCAEVTHYVESGNISLQDALRRVLAKPEAML